MATTYRPPPGPGEPAAAPGSGAMAHRRGTSGPPAHILVVNGRKVHQPVFVLGTPWSGTELLARSLKRSPGFHLTMGQRWVLPVVHGFARSPSIVRGRQEAAATALRDALAQGWQVNAYCCLGCSQACREAGGAAGSTGPCVSERGIARYGDASPELLYCAESLVAAFPDARLVQIIRDGRDVAAAMLADPQALAWFQPGVVNLAAEPTHPLLGVENEADRSSWPAMSLPGKCALRWRSAVRLMARLRGKLTAQQLITLRYEEMVRQPAAAASAVSAFIGADVPPLAAPAQGSGLEPGYWRRVLALAQVAEVERVASEELRRVGYGT